MKKKRKNKIKSEEPIFVYSERKSEYNKNSVREYDNYITDYIWDEMGCLKEYIMNKVWLLYLIKIFNDIKRIICYN